MTTTVVFAAQTPIRWLRGTEPTEFIDLYVKTTADEAWDALDREVRTFEHMRDVPNRVVERTITERVLTRDTP